MSAPPSRASVIPLAEDLEDPVLVRALGRGDERGVRGLVDRHFDAVYGALRMALPNPRQAESAATETFVSAAGRASVANAADAASSWLLRISLEQVAARPPAIPIAAARRRIDEVDAAADSASSEEQPKAVDALRTMRDEALAAMVRTLDPDARQALVLTVVCGLDETEVALALGRQPAQVRRLRADAVAVLTRRLEKRAHEQAALKQEFSERNPYDLTAEAPNDYVRDGRGPNPGAKILRDGRVKMTPPPEISVLALVRKALKRLIERLKGEKEFDLDDDVGGGGGPRTALNPTPSQQAFERPKSTPSTQTYDRPESTIGTAAYRMPKTTPSTSRLSNPSRPAVAQANAWASSARRTGR